MLNVRTRAEVLAKLTSLSQEEHNQLKACGAADNKYWNTSENPGATWVGKFRAEAKTYYYFRQSRRCCYCSKELDRHNGTFDAEHIIDKDTYPLFMFDLANIAAACKTCNGAKGKNPVLVEGEPPDRIPSDSEAYLLVHPHIDEWTDYLEFDSVGRIVAKEPNGKGSDTIRLCGIGYLNAARLADHFLPADNEAAQKALEGFFRVTNRTWKLKYIRILRKMVDDFDLAKARAILDLLEKEMA